MEMTNVYGSADLLSTSIRIKDMHYIIIDDVLYFQMSNESDHYSAIRNTKEIHFIHDDMCISGRCKEVGKTTYNIKYLELVKQYFCQKDVLEEQLFVLVITNIEEKEKRHMPFLFLNYFFDCFNKLFILFWSTNANTNIFRTKSTNNNTMLI